MNQGLPRRPLVWLDGALDVCLTFPSAVRRRIGCELVSVRRWGIGRSWELVRGAAGSASFAVRDAPRGFAPQVYRAFAATSLPAALVIVHASVRAPVRGKPWPPPADVGSVRARVLDVALDMHERRTMDTARVLRRLADENVFLQLGFSEDEAVDLARRAELISELRRQLMRRANDAHADAVTRAVFDGDVDAANVESLQQLADRIGARGLQTW